MYSDGYKYWLAYKKGNASYFRCCRYKSNCLGKCVVVDNVVKHTKPHSHPADADQVLVDKFRNVLTQRAYSEKTDLHAIYLEEATQRHSEASMIYTFSQAESCMRKARKKKPPRPPNTLQELSDILEKSDLFKINSRTNKDQFYQTTLSLEDTTCLIFMHKKTLKAAGKIEELHVDCSIDVQPLKPPNYHLLTAHSVEHHHSIPIFYVIMTSKTQSGYMAVFSHIRDQLMHPATPTSILSNFDETMQTVLSLIFPEATVKGCWFHYTDGVLKRMKSLELTRQTAKGHGSSALRMLLVLPLLPANYMAPGLEAIKKWLKDKECLSRGFVQLCDYIEQTWLNGIGAEKISIFSISHSINNHVKNFNKTLLEDLEIKNPVIWHMLECLTLTATKQFAKLKRRSKHHMSATSKPLTKTQLVQDTIIQNSTQTWIKTAVHLRNPLLFLQLCSPCINDALILSNDDPKPPPKSLLEEPPTSSKSSLSLASEISPEDQSRKINLTSLELSPVILPKLTPEQDSQCMFLEPQPQQLEKPEKPKHLPLLLEQRTLQPHQRYTIMQQQPLPTLQPFPPPKPQPMLLIRKYLPQPQQSQQYFFNSDLNCIQQVDPSSPATDPPPLAFFPKVNVRPQYKKIHYSKDEPPPLSPFSD